jgi:steroid delta-isomerase
MTEADTKAALQAYIDGFNAGDAEAIISLFADDASIEDPAGGEVVDGIDAIGDFYRQGVGCVTHMELSAPIRASHTSAAAMAFDFEMNIEGQIIRTSAIDVMEFDDAGKIRRMRAYWGPSDSRVVEIA